MTVTGCGHFGSFLPPELEELSLSFVQNKTFVVGDKIDDCVDVEIKGVYSNGKVCNLQRSDVDLYYESVDKCSHYSVGTPIPEAGEYAIRAFTDGAVSKAYNFTASQSRVYAESIQISDDVEEITIAPGQTKTISLSVAPTDYTETISYSLRDSTIASVKRIYGSTFEIQALEEGETSVCFNALLSPKQNFTSFILRLIVSEVPVTSISIKNCPTHVSAKYTTYVNLAVSPANFTSEITACCLNEKATITKMNDTSFLVNFLEAGETEIWFTAENKFAPDIHIYQHIFISEVYATKLHVEGQTNVGINDTVEVTASLKPEYCTVDPQAYGYDSNIINVEATERDYNKVIFLVTGKQLGGTDMYFKVQSSDNSWLTVKFHIDVCTVYATDIKIQGPTKINKDYEGYLYADVQPSNYSLEVDVTRSNKNVAVFKTDKNTFLIRGIYTGTTKLTFVVKKSETSVIKYIHTITVLERRPTRNIKQVYHDFAPQILRPTSSEYDPVNVLVIPVWFTDSGSQIGDFDKSEVWQDIYDAWFGDESKVKYETVTSYYRKESFGKFELYGNVAPWQNAECASSDIEDYIQAVRLAQKIVDDYFLSCSTLSRKDYDSNGDGYLDYVALIACCHPNSGLSSYKTATGNLCCTDAPTLKALIWSDIYSCRDYEADTEKDDLLRVSPLIHETGHMFGLWDYYHSNLYGGFNMQGANDAAHDPWSVMAIGWANPIIPTKTMTITINDFVTSHEFVLLTPGWNEYDSPFDEFIIVELLGATGLNKYFAELDHSYLVDNAGIRVYHVDARLANKTTNPWQFTTNTKSGYSLAFDSTLVDGDQESIDNISLLQMIRNNKNRSINYYNGGYLKEDDLFHQGDTFDFESHKDQFFNYWLAKHKYIAAHGQPQTANEQTVMDSSLKKYLTLDDGRKLGWSFKVDKIYNNPDGHISATITFTKEA